MVMVMKKLVYGVGINDSDEKIEVRINGVRIMCPFYRVWSNMLRRCYSSKYQSVYPTYLNCSVCDEWLTFSDFKLWMQNQIWEGKELDKDLLVVGNKVYSPDTCCFVSRNINLFITDRSACRGDYPLGVSYHKHSGKFKSECGDPLMKSSKLIGYFNCPQQAHKAWKKRKHELACQLAELQIDQRVAYALRVRYL